MPGLTDGDRIVQAQPKEVLAGRSQYRGDWANTGVARMIWNEINVQGGGQEAAHSPVSTETQVSND